MHADLSLDRNNVKNIFFFQICMPLGSRAWFVLFWLSFLVNQSALCHCNWPLDTEW